MNSLNKTSNTLKTVSLCPLMIAAMLASTGSQAQAVSDEVAVQLLERLGQLESELSDLKGENEILRNELSKMQNLQREGFLEVDERIQNLKQERTSNTNITQPPANVSVSGQLAPADKTEDSDDIPALEAAVSNDVNFPGNSPLTNTSSPPTPNTNNKENDRNSAAISVNLDKNPPASLRNGNNSYYYYNSDDNKISENKKEDDTQSTTQTSNKRSIPASHQAKAEYNQAYKTLVNNPADAIPAFRAFLEKYPEHELAANAQYWLGEALYAEKDFNAAAKEFMAVLKEHEDSAKAPGAALKLGYSFYEMKKWAFARRTLEDTVRFFPDSNSAKLAKMRLQRMDKDKR